MPDLQNREAFERRLEKGLREALEHAEPEITAILYRDGMTARDLRVMPESVRQTIIAQLSPVLAGILDDVYVEASSNFASLLSFGIDLANVEQRAQAWANDYAPRLAEQMASTSVNLLQNFSAREATPLTVGLLGALVRQALGLGSRNRPEMVAITEVSNAISEGETATQDALSAEGAEVVRVWFTQLDERVCPVCAPRHGSIEGDMWTSAPPAHPRCRCYLGYRVRNNGQQVILFDDDAVQRRLRR